ncbi:MAG: type II toxin-antitoxin system RelE/ParE family toxin [Planctomycetes bacterium]|nr:type II toxin-antitoxin system RelE/ParE family toxin [Planctomycetota bacterium]
MADVELHPRAVEEARHVRRRYARVSPRLASRFVAELDVGIAAIGASPQAHSPHQHGARVYRLPGFPYLLVYLEVDPNTVLLLAVMHTSRRPGYWRRRLP